VANNFPPVPTAFPPIEEGSDGKPTFSPVWLQWFIAIGQLAQAGGQGDTNPVIQVAPTGSPFVYQNSTQFDEVVLLIGGTWTLLEISKDGSTYFNSSTSGQNGLAAYLSSGEFIRLTYTVAPNIVLFPT
jgi:hypothetical protein